MKTVCLLRGINVTGRRKIAMADLRSMAADRGLQGVRTLLQSGNLVCDTPQEPVDLPALLSSGIREQFGHEVEVLAFSSDRWSEIIAACPFDPTPFNPSRVFVTFLAEARTDLDHLDKARPDDLVHLVDDRVYLHLPDGYGQTKLHNAFFERRLHTVATTRNWRTTLKLAALCEDS